MEFNPENFNIPEGIAHWAFVSIAVTAIFLLAALVRCMLSRGFFQGFETFGNGLLSTVKDLFSTSIRRTMAIARLTFKEAIRRKALFVFVVFCILFMFAGWFLARGGDRPQLQVKAYISFVLTSITWLLLVVMLLLSCRGIPEDIRLRSLHTVVTKPTRRIEIVLGRILGFTGIGLLVLAVMGVTGYVWINRQLTDDQKGILTCRVPVYGPLEFLSDTGQPEESGINVGDMWKHRSYIAGTSQARAIWTFDGITKDRVGDEGLTLESNFEAFRTHKGNMKTGGLIAQYMLVQNQRAAAFANIASSNNFQRAANELRRGQYQNAAESLYVLGNKLEANQIEFVRGELDELSRAFQEAGDVIDGLPGPKGEDWVFEISQAFWTVATQAGDDASFGDAAGDYVDLGTRLRELSEKVEEHQAELREHLTRLSVPLPSFVVREYRFGENVLGVEQDLTFSANNEDITRFLSAHLSKLSEDGRLVEDGALPSDLAERLYEGDLLTIENADQAATVVKQLVQSGDLVVEGSKLIPADDQSMFSLINQVVTDGRLSADDGWELTANLFDDLVSEDGQLRVEVACLSAGQYLGMAKPDLFVRLPDRPFASGYFKAIASIGMMMALIVTFGVCASCFVKGPVAIFLTLSILIIGQPFAYEFMNDLVNEKVEGGGFVEALIRMAKQQNPQVPLGINENVEKAVKAVDGGIFNMLNLVKNIVPQLDPFTQGTRFVENGFDVPYASCISRCIFTLIGFLLPCLLIGFVSLRFRELEAK